MKRVGHGWISTALAASPGEPRAARTDISLVATADDGRHRLAYAHRRSAVCVALWRSLCGLKVPSARLRWRRPACRDDSLIAVNKPSWREKLSRSLTIGR